MLLSFGFVIVLPTDVNFQGIMYQWDSTLSSVNGSALFTSDSMNTPSDSNVVVNITLPTPIELEPDTQYVIFLHTLPAVSGSGSMQIYNMPPAPYQGGSFVYYNSPPDDYSGPWSNVGLGAVASFYTNYA